VSEKTPIFVDTDLIPCRQIVAAACTVLSEPAVRKEMDTGTTLADLRPLNHVLLSLWFDLRSLKLLMMLRSEERCLDDELAMGM
jgi:hypothetical protein